MRTKYKREKQKFCRETLSKFFYDMAKATFSTTVVGDMATMVFKEQVTTASVGLFIIGLLTTVAFAFSAYKVSQK